MCWCHKNSDDEHVWTCDGEHVIMHTFRINQQRTCTKQPRTWHSDVRHCACTFCRVTMFLALICIYSSICRDLPFLVCSYHYWFFRFEKECSYTLLWCFCLICLWFYLLLLFDNLQAHTITQVGPRHHEENVPVDVIVRQGVIPSPAAPMFCVTHSVCDTPIGQCICLCAITYNDHLHGCTIKTISTK